ncbi:pheromone processing endoprotease, variant 2 [Entomophthora muscae]|uniref:Pheromone processing endoprotease, variant 2 n=1 Tax=Entomophthora muscae TaxID=34485 RepID=A0ACC2TYL3_9FUNG|nr:pheromone processing endoprotease, variant 2 [Entomophthora muscae]
MLFFWVFLAKVAVSQQNPNYTHDKYSYYTPDKYRFINNTLQLVFTSNLSSFDKFNIKSKQFKFQWYLHNDLGGNDLNVKKVWEMGVTGKGVYVGIIDTGLLHSHSDFKLKYAPEASFDFTYAKEDSPSNSTVHAHGTKVAGLIASPKDGQCGAGIAFDAKISDIHLSFANGYNATAVALALQHKNDINDIYSCSWGLKDNGRSQHPLPEIILKALENGAKMGRKRKGSVFVFAAGNGNLADDFCSFSSETNSIYTITVGAIDHRDRYALYSATCSGVLVTSYSGINGTGTIVTTNYAPKSDAIVTTKSAPKSDSDDPTEATCTTSFSYTSASAAMVSGVLALLLEKFPYLTWRDIQHLLIKSATPVQEDHYSWSPTYAQRKHSTHFGFGRVDAYKLLVAAKTHTLVDPAKDVQFNFTGRIEIPRRVAVQSCFNTGYNLLLEHVTVTLNVIHRSRKGLKVALKSPNGFISPLVFPRANDNSTNGFVDLEVLTLKHW